MQQFLHHFGASGADLGAILGSFWGGLGVIWGKRGPNGWRAASWALWRSSGGALGTIWGPTWSSPGRPFGPSWGRQGPSWGHLGAILGDLGPSWGDLGPSWGSLGALGGASGATVAPSVRIVIIIGGSAKTSVSKNTNRRCLNSSFVRSGTAKR